MENFPPPIDPGQLYKLAANSILLVDLVGGAGQGFMRIIMKTLFESISGFGYRTADIARHLGISESTVEGYWKAGWTIPEEITQKLITLKNELLVRRYG